MRTRKDKEPDTDEAPRRKPKAGALGKRVFYGNKATCSRLKAVAAFYSVKDWVEEHEPEFFSAFASKQEKVQRKRK